MTKFVNTPHTWNVTPEQYQDAIPGCCRLRTVEDHAEVIMFCWGLLNQLKLKIPSRVCGMCEFNAEPAAAEQLLEWNIAQSKKRVWKKIGGKEYA